MVKKLKVGLVSAVQPSFWGSSEKQYEKYYTKKIVALSQKLGFDLYVIKESLVDIQDAERAKKEVIDQGIDFLLIQLTTFAGGDLIEPLAETGTKIGLWAVPEITDTGAIPLNSFCGINMYSSIISQYMSKGIKTKWFYGDVEDELFIDRFTVTIKAMNAVKNLNGSRVALVGGIAPGFNNLYFDERKTKNKLGVKVDQLHEFGDIKNRALSYKEADIRPIVAEISEEACCVTPDARKSLDATARVYKAFEDMILENGYRALAIGCWPKYRKELGIVVCSVIGRLLEKGYIAACEGDIDSAVSMMVLKDITGEYPMLMDLSKLDFKDQSVLMWHCGSAPKKYADSKGMTLAGHYKPGSRITGADDIKVGTVNDMYFKPTPITIARFTWEYEKMLLASGELTDRQDRSYDGSRGWVGKLHLNGKPINVKDFINTLMVQKFQHHYPIVSGTAVNELMEFMAWLDIAPIKPVEYQDYMQNTSL
jgi:L-fucose isomerase-like protein